MSSRVLKSGLAIFALALVAGCGVRGAPNVAPPLFGETDMPPGVPRPFQIGSPAPLPQSIPPQPPGEPGEND